MADTEILLMMEEFHKSNPDCDAISAGTGLYERYTEILQMQYAPDFIRPLWSIVYDGYNGSLGDEYTYFRGVPLVRDRTAEDFGLAVWSDN
jgi:hypothetical protein